jgi:hypothetical protein
MSWNIPNPASAVKSDAPHFQAEDSGYYPSRHTNPSRTDVRLN